MVGRWASVGRWAMVGGGGGGQVRGRRDGGSDDGWGDAWSGRLGGSWWQLVGGRWLVAGRVAFVSPITKPHNASSRASSLPRPALIP